MDSHTSLKIILKKILWQQKRKLRKQLRKLQRKRLQRKRSNSISKQKENPLSIGDFLFVLNFARIGKYD